MRVFLALALLASSPACASLGAKASNPELPRSLRAVRSSARPRLDEPVASLESGALEDYVRFALEHDPGLRAQFERWRAAEEKVEVSGRLADPRLTFVEFLEEIQTRTGPQERRFGLEQAIPLGGKREGRRTVARHGAERQRHELERARDVLVRDVALAYHDFAFLAVDTGISVETLALLRDLEPIVQGRVQSGGRQEDLVRLQIEIGKLENEVASRRELVRVHEARLAALLGWDGGALPAPELTEPAPSELSASAVLFELEAANPELGALRAEIERSLADRDLVGAANVPDLVVGLEYIQTGSRGGVDGSGDDPIGLKLGVNLPVWRGAQRAEERSADHALRAAHARFDDRMEALRAEVALRAFELSDAERRVLLYRDSLLPRAELALEQTIGSYRAGDALFLDLIASERTRLELSVSYWRACRDAHQARARLLSLIGGGA